MKRKQSLLFGAVAFLILILVSGFWLYNWVLGETESASEPISAPTLAVENPAAATQPVASPPLQISSQRLLCQPRHKLRKTTTQQVRLQQYMRSARMDRKRALPFMNSCAVPPRM